MRHDRAIFLERKDLLAEDQLLGHSFDLRELESQRQCAVIDELDSGRDLLEVDQRQKVVERNLLVQLFDLFLPGDLLQLLAP